ncbi:MAG: hypothetical protein PF443_11200 [Allgaiera sp.]|jgi:hypothetical protein|nr:hypothetical protein [Allgaiera sp.]
MTMLHSRELPTEKIWELAHTEERFFIDGMHKSFAFFASLNSAIFGATVAGAMKAERPLDFAFLLLGPVIILSCSVLGKIATSRFYFRFLEAITIIAKLESDMGLAQPRSEESDSSRLWPSEAISPTRHIVDQRAFSSSSEFVNSLRNEGYQKISSRVFIVFELAAVLLALLFLYLSTASFWISTT